MKKLSGKQHCVLGRLGVALVGAFLAAPLQAQLVSLEAVVTPSTVIVKDAHTVSFAIHGFIEFKSLAELFPYIDSQTERWKTNGKLSGERRQLLAHSLLREGIESRVISMTDDRPLEALMTHTRDELQSALKNVKEPVPPGYAEAFVDVQTKWKHSLNCWSAAPSIPARVLSNWYPIEEGISLYGATYDSTEHFWQAVKYHPEITVGDLTKLLETMQQVDWKPWIARLDADPDLYLPNAYSVEFLRQNLSPERLSWFQQELTRHGLQPADLVYTFSQPDDPIRRRLAESHFDGIYLGARRMGFISEEFRSLMPEIWRVKYLQMPRFREVISGIPAEVRLEHFLNDGDSPDIPIPVYVGYLNQIRELARSQQNK